MTIETTDLERRVLAHERILQALIAHIDETEPKFMDRLKATFAHAHVLGADEQDFTVTDQHAERFIREVVALGEQRKTEPLDDAGIGGSGSEEAGAALSSRSHSPID